MEKIAVGIITYRESTAKYLSQFLESLKNQREASFSLFVYDNSDDGSITNKNLLENSGLIFDYSTNGKNIGFGQAYNKLIAKALKQDFAYFALLNIDMLLEPLFLKRLFEALQQKESWGASIPKLLRWDFENKIKTGVVDSDGLIADRYFRFFDKNQGKKNRTEELPTKTAPLGFTGAAALLRLKALSSIAYGQEFFDESMFMYKEDCDLSLRLRLAGWQTGFVPSAIAYHDRTAAAPGKSLAEIIKNRKHKSQQLKRWSFLNQLILLYKFSRFLPYPIKLKAWLYQAFSIAYAVIFETYLLQELPKFWHLRNNIKEKSLAIKQDISQKEITELFF